MSGYTLLGSEGGRSSSGNGLSGGGGGGARSIGGNGLEDGTGGNGGEGYLSSITGSPVVYGSGGAANGLKGPGTPGTNGGAVQPFDASSTLMIAQPTSATATLNGYISAANLILQSGKPNTGAGGAAGNNNKPYENPTPGSNQGNANYGTQGQFTGAGGSGVVILRFKQPVSGTAVVTVDPGTGNYPTPTCIGCNNLRPIIVPTVDPVPVYVRMIGNVSNSPLNSNVYGTVQNYSPEIYTSLGGSTIAPFVRPPNVDAAGYVTAATSGGLTVTGGLVASTPVGNYQVSYVSGLTQQGTGSLYVLRPDNATAWAVKARPLTITAVADTKVYDRLNTSTATPTLSITGLGSGDVVSALSQSFSDVNAGSGIGLSVNTGYDIKNASNVSMLSNYTITLVGNSSGVITRANLPVTGLTAINKGYDNLTTATLGGTGSISPIAGDTVTLGGTASGNFADASVGTSKPVTITGLTISGLQAGNYTLVQQTGLTADITKATLSVTGLTASNKVYDGLLGATLGGTAALSGTIYSGDSITLSGTPSGSFADKNVGTAKPVSASGLTLSGTGLSNYTLVQQTGLTAEITPATLTITGASANPIYTGAAQTNAYTVANLMSGDSVTSVSGRASGTNVGLYTDNLASATGTGLSNYNINYVNGAMTIAKANLTVTGATGSVTYTSNSQTNTYSVNGLLGTDAVTSVSGSASGTIVGSYTDSLSAASGTGLSNYNIGYVDGVMTIAKANLTVTGSTATSPYTSNAQTNTYSVSGLLGTDAVSSVSGIATGTNVNTYADSLSAASGTGLSNYNISYVNGALTITKANLTVTGDTTSTTYNRTAQTNTYKVNGLLGTDAVSSVSGKATGTNVSTYSDTLSAATGTGLSNYNISYVNGSLSIMGAPLTITGATSSSPYSGSAQTNTYSVAGLLGTDAVSSVLGRATGTNVNTYADTLSGATGTGLSNYSISYVNGSMTINPVSLTVTGATSSVPYTSNAQTNAYTVSGLLGSDVVSSVSGRASGTNVGPYTDSLSAATGTGLSNYNISYVDGGLTINPVNLTVTGATTSTAYNRTAQTNSYSVTGLLGADAVSAVSGSASGTNAGGPYPDSLSAATGTGLSNYNISYVNGALTIAKAIVTVSGFTAADKVYNGNTDATLSSGSVSTSGVYVGDTVTVNVGTLSGSFDTKNVGSSKTVTITGISLGGSDVGNYQLSGGTNATTTASITAAPLSITGVNTSQTYNAYTHINGTASVSGLIPGENVTVSGYGTGRNAGSYTDSLVATADSVTSLSNYNISYVNGALTINPANLTVTGATSSVPYTSNAQTNTYAVTGLLGSDAVSSVSGRASGTNVGPYTDNLSAATGTGLSNYNISYVNGGLTINPANLTVTGATSSVPYTSNAQTNTYAVTGLLGSDVVSSVSGRATGTNANTYADTLSAATGTGLSNYNISYVNGALTITKANLSVVGATTSATYNQSAQTNSTATVTGLKGADSITVVGYGSGTNIGTYADSLSASGAALSNYNVSYTNGALTITGAPLTITGATSSSTYSGIAQTNTYSVSGLLGSDAVTSVSGRATGTNANTYADTLSAATGTGLSNYNISYVNGALTITKANLSVVGATATTIYNSNAQTNAYAVSGLLGSDAVSSVSGRATGTNANTYADTLSAAIGTGLSNYNIRYVNGTLKINPASVTVSGITAADKVYNGNSDATLNNASVTTAGVYAGDSVTVNMGSLNASFDTKNVGNLKTVTITGIGLGGASVGNYQLSGGTSATTTASITAAPLSISGVSSTKTYNATTQRNGEATVNGLISGESVTVSGLGAGRNVGNFNDALVATAGAGTSLSNYTVSYTNGSLIITPYQLNATGGSSISPGLSASANDKVYNGKTGATGSIAVSLFAGDNLTANSFISDFDTKDVGMGKTVRFSDVTLAGDAATRANYALPANGSVRTTANINAAPLAITGANTSATFSDITQINGLAAISGLVSGESVIVSGYGSGRNVGSYSDALVATSGAGTNLSNYNISFSNGSLIITPASRSRDPEAGPLVLSETAASAAAISSRSSPIISVLVVRQSSTEIGGIVVVYVPKELATSGLGFSFVIPDTLFNASAEVPEADNNQQVEAKATLINGDPLPQWLSFDPKTKLITASAVPDRGFPVEIVITEGKKVVTVVISERASGT
jgi:mucin-19